MMGRSRLYTPVADVPVYMKVDPDAASPPRSPLYHGYSTVPVAHIKAVSALLRGRVDCMRMQVVCVDRDDPFIVPVPAFSVV